jgi:two-component system chemotaxis response regulator CheB
MLARVPVVKHVAGLRTQAVVSPASAAAAAGDGGVLGGAKTPSCVDREIPVLGIVASAGGPAAISYVLSRLPADFEGCVAVVQHMLPGFAKSFVEFLRVDATLPVELVTEPMRPRPGLVLVAPDQRHLVRTHAGTWALSDAATRRGYRPSADALLSSLAETCGARAVGVILSGIGDDGAQGLLAMRNAGAVTIAQDEASSAVYGMPRAAREHGAAAHILALGDIPAMAARQIRRLAHGGPPAQLPAPAPPPPRKPPPV